MKYLKMETMTQGINYFLWILCFTFINCNQIKDNKTNTSDNIKEKQLEKSFLKEKNQEEDYDVWFSLKNTSDKYSDFQILLGKDSIKVVNSKTEAIICNGEIIKGSESFSSYIGSRKNAELIKSRLKSLFSINIEENIQVIQNSESDISKKGCQFPFYEMFIAKDLLIFYDGEYYFFAKEKELITQDDFLKKYKYSKLPFDFSDYINLYYNDDEKCNQRYPYYASPELDNILSFFAIEESPSKVFMLPPYKEFQPIIIAYTDSDVEGYYLFIAKQGQVISSKQIAKMDGKLIEDFIINENFEIELFSRKNIDGKRILKKSFKVQEDGLMK